MLQLHAPNRMVQPEPVVVTGIGMVTALGPDRASTWKAVRQGRVAVRRIDPSLGLPEVLKLGAIVPGFPQNRQLKVIHLAHRAAEEAISDSAIDLA